MVRALLKQGQKIFSWIPGSFFGHFETHRSDYRTQNGEICVLVKEFHLRLVNDGLF